MNSAFGGREPGRWRQDADRRAQRLEARTDDAEGFVLAGGQSSRMGRDKALVEFAGEPLIARACEILRGAGLRARIAGAQIALDRFAPVVSDAASGQGPLSGIVAALAALNDHARWAVFLPVDLPLLPPSLIRYLLRHAQIEERIVTVPSVSGFAQTFPAIVDRRALPALRAALATHGRGCYAAFQAAAISLGQAVSVVAVELLAQTGQVAEPRGLPTPRWFLNVNTARDLTRAERLAAPDCVSCLETHG